MRVEGLGKKYRLGREIPPASSLGGKMKQAVTAPFDWLASQMREPSEEEILWALKDVSFEIKRGEVVGFIGHNGAGKSTLLKILSRITEPTEGFAEIHGRIAALLEVGTGMHPELTGRENIYMNGTVLGMKKREIDRKFDDIVDFSGIEKFLDTPVKRYSSGMRVRLGFAIAAHLEPEILIVDEVLAVGDADFQKKCLGKMEDVANAGRTVLFVSHRMAAIRSLCSRVVLMSGGKIVLDDEPNLVIPKYLSLNAGESQIADTEAHTQRTGSRDVIFAGFHLENPSGKRIETISVGDDAHFVFTLKVNRAPVTGVDLCFSLHTVLGDKLTYLFSSYQNQCWEFPNEGYEHIRCTIPNFPFAPGRILVKGLLTVDQTESDWPKPPIGVIDIELGDFYGTGGTNLKDGVPCLVKGLWSRED